MKTDKQLGLKVRDYLIEKGVETPVDENRLTRNEKVELIDASMHTIIQVLGLDTQDDSISGTATRVAKMWVDELCYGLDYTNFPRCTLFDNKMGFDSMVIQRDITFHSMCEHHFQNITGMAQVAYIPNGKVVGLSKLNRIVNFFARRPQVQERLNEQIYFALEYVLGTSDVAVLLEADHYCVKARGCNDQNSSMTTSRLGAGFFEDGKLRNEFMQLAVRS